tara:strand:- start:41 stop:241 length:201 start_codon:yes stop_codon:yes gene_type:complete
MDMTKEPKEILKHWRLTNNLSQTQAAKELGYASYVSISYFETGKREIPNYLLVSLKKNTESLQGTK